MTKKTKDQLTAIDLISMEDTELLKMNKTELIAAIKRERWTITSAISSVKALKEQLDTQRIESDSACIILSAYLGKELERDYNGNVEKSKLKLLELVGETLSSK